MKIIDKRVIKQAFERLEEKSEILAISKKYKNILVSLIDSSDIKYPMKPRLVGRGLCNLMADLDNPLTESKLDKDLLNLLLQQH